MIDVNTDFHQHAINARPEDIAGNHESIVKMTKWDEFKPVQGENEPSNISNRRDSMSEINDFLTVKYVADKLSVSERYIRLLISGGELPSYKFGRAVRIPADGLSQYVEERNTLKGDGIRGSSILEVK
jgi:excisionase family DNA binding protein